MSFLTQPVGQLPLGIWLSSIILGLIAGLNMIFQTISIIDWKLAMKLRVQEHAPDDPDTVNRTHMVMEWGFSVADVVSHIIIVPLAIFFVLKARPWGFVLCSYLYLFYFYVAIMATAQRWGLVKFGLKESFREYAGVLKIIWIQIIIALIGAVSLWSNPGYFGL